MADDQEALNVSSNSSTSSTSSVQIISVERPSTSNEMDEYDKKFAEMQKYVPFVEAMIERLQNVTDKSREAQLQKMQSLHGILSNSKRKLKIETLQRCEDVLQKLQTKVEKGNSSELGFAKRRNEVNPISARREDSKPERPVQNKIIHEIDLVDETPRSPSPPRSPDPVSQAEPVVTPIIIPTERSDELDDKPPDKPASPDQTHVLPTKAPIVIPTERKDDDSNSSSSKSSGSIQEIQETEEQRKVKNDVSQWLSILNQGDVATAVKIVGNSLPSKVNNDSRSHNAPSSSSRNLSNFTVPSLNGSKISTPSSHEKVTSFRTDSSINFNSTPKEVFSKPKPVSPPKVKEANLPQSSNKSFLASPASVLTEPPLSREDLAELLGDGNEKRRDPRCKDPRLHSEDVSKIPKPPEPPVVNTDTVLKDPRLVRGAAARQPDFIKENEKRWEQIDKLLTKCNIRKPLPTSSPIVSTHEALKTGESKGCPIQTITSSGTSVSSAIYQSSLSSKSDPRFGDNYERHSRGPDKGGNIVGSSLHRPLEEEKNPVPFSHSTHQENIPQLDDRMYPRRRQTSSPMDNLPPRSDAEFIRSDHSPDYYARQMPTSHPNWSASSASFSSSYSTDYQQWMGQNTYTNVGGNPMQPTPPHSAYQHGMHQDMWNAGMVSTAESQMRSNQYAPNQPIINNNININTNISSISTTNIRPLMSTMTHPPEPNLGPRIEPEVPPVMGPHNFPMSNQYRNSGGDFYENPYDAAHGRPASWDVAPNMRPNDPLYRGEMPNETPNSPLDSGNNNYVRPPATWKRDWDRNSRGRGGGGGGGGGAAAGGYYGDRNRGEQSRNSFNRRPDWPRDNNTRFPTSHSDRDGRGPRGDSNTLTSGKPGDINTANSNTSIRDPRLSKDKFQPIPKPKDPPSTDRDPRKRIPPPSISPNRTNKSSEQSSKSDSSDQSSSTKPTNNEKVIKDMQSPLESLYGVIDTKAKSVSGSGLQKFKIPKLKRPEPAAASSSSSVSHKSSTSHSEETKESSSSSSRHSKSDSKEKSSSSSRDSSSHRRLKEEKSRRHRKKDKDGSTEVSSSSDHKRTDEKERESASSKSESTDDSGNSHQNTAREADSNISKTTTESEEKESDSAKQKEETSDITKEFIEKLIKQSLEREGKKFLEQEKLIKKLKEALRVDKLKKIINSESETGSSSDKEDSEQQQTEMKKSSSKKKRRVILSDSSEDESLAERLGNLGVDGSKKKSHRKEHKRSGVEKSTTEENSETKEQTTGSHEDASSTTTVSQDSKDTKLNKSEKKDGKSKSGTEDIEMIDDGNKDNTTKSTAPKGKTKRRNSLEMLQEDIREMFISEGVVAATGHRMCRLAKETQHNDGAEKTNSDVNSDQEQSLSRDSKSRSPDKMVKSGRCRSKKQGTSNRARRRSKDVIHSSDSEEDQPLSSRADQPILPESEDNVTKNQECENEGTKDSSEGPRRSKRVIRKEVDKEARVMVEKTDIFKIDSSKVIVESSSDESFDADGSETTTAVDANNEPQEKPKDPKDQSDKKKKPIRNRKRSISKKNNSSDNKNDDAVSDEESLTTAKSSNDKTKSQGKSNEEEVSGNNDATADQTAEGMDKDSDGDVDENAVDPLATESSNKKAAGRKKKKPVNRWSMGIVSKKKKKKTPTALPSDDTSKDTGIESNETADPQTNAEGFNSKHKLLKVKSKKPLDDDEIFKGATENKETTEKGKWVEKDITNITTQNLIDYFWSRQEKYKCLLCSFNGKNIVHHYKSYHPNQEVMISRLNEADAETAIVQTKELKKVYDRLEENDLRTFNCRFCAFSNEGMKSTAMEAFYEHCTTHTGEYRFRCKNCPYQTVAKSSMKSHFYKVCRDKIAKVNMSVNEAIDEEQIPDENAIYGYLCSGCNFVQLQRSNLEKHIKFWHKGEESTVEIVKIDMSVNAVDVSMIDVGGVDKIKLSPSTKIEPMNDPLLDQDSCIDDKKDTDPEFEEIDKILKCKQEELEEEENRTKTLDKADLDEMDDIEQQGTLSSGNLSVFVSTPGLENKEVEIQLERQKKMQEIVDNIGIKFHKDDSKKGQSIIDKLKDKMQTTDLGNVEEQSNETDNISPAAPSSPLVPIISAAFSLTSAIDDDNNDNAETSIEPPIPVENIKKNPDDSEIINETQSKIEDPLTAIEKTIATNGNETVSTSSATVPTVTSTTPSLLAELSSESNTNDPKESSEPPAAAYDSDSSSEQSDNEPITDVNTILQETSNINASSNAPMLTTIQRLAAQLQIVKSLPSTGETTPIQSPSKVIVKTEKTSPSESLIKKEPTSPNAVVKTEDPFSPAFKSSNVVPISCIKRILSNSEDLSSEQKDDANEKSPPKNFIRLRRLSGDKLSVPAQPSENAQEDNDAISGGEESSRSEGTGEILQTDTEEECSFLKIANVVSLAPNSNNDGTENSLISDIRKAVETSPVNKSKGISLLKKNTSPLILKRYIPPIAPKIPGQSGASETVKLIPFKSLPPVSTMASQITSYIPIVPKTAKTTTIQLEPQKLAFPVNMNSSSIITSMSTRPMTVTVSSSNSNQNFKLVKVVRSTNNTLKIQEPKVQEKPALPSQIKTPETYNEMLKPAKLSHMYKCMGSECSFTTDSVESFHLHFEQHVEIVGKILPNFVHDFQKCAYCATSQEDWLHMKLHMEKKHLHCRYQCKYCFYRAVVPSYVEIHQAQCHAGNRLAVIVGKLLKEVPTREQVNRREFVHPFVCQNNCDKWFYVPELFAAHIKNQHGNLYSYKCHLCQDTFPKIEQLTAHYTTHNYSKFQCLYCLSGGDTVQEVHNHLSTFHYNRLSLILERTLTPQAVKHKDILEQLVLRNMDENLRIPDIHKGLENDPKLNADRTPTTKEVSSSNILSSTKITYSKTSKDTILLEKEKPDSTVSSKLPLHNNKIYTTTIQDIVGTLKVSKNPANSNEVMIRTGVDKSSSQDKTNTVEKSSVENKKYQTIGEKKTLTSSKKIYPASSHILQEPELQLLSFNNDNANAVDPLGIIDTNCSDEFINMNILDNPELFKNVRFSSNKDQENKNESNKGDDVDLEVLGGTVKDVPKPSTNTSPDEKDSKNDQEQHTFLTTENTSTSLDSDNNTNSSFTENKASSSQFLTLADIKDSGVDGVDLFKCGYDDCDYGAPTAADLRSHAKDCSHRNDEKSLNCVHCKKRFLKIGFLIDHMKIHGLKRFGCSLCENRYAMSHQAITHMKAKHKMSDNKLIPADPKNPSADGLFVVHPVLGIERKGKKRKGGKLSDKSLEKVLGTEKFTFSPDDIEMLPRQAIYNREVHCAVCSYTTKVRTNIIRHLQLHAKDETVPETGPVNPVPCLDKKEKMFDKMVNLASSSHQNGRMGAKMKETTVIEEEDDAVPKFVPEHKRYVCGVPECNYLTVDEGMLRYHLKALHSEEPYFRCPHCPQPQPGQENQNVAIDKMGVHLKMHDARLYKCSHCNHHHYHRHVVERHLSDKHPEKRQFVKVVREPESPENAQQGNTGQEDAEEDASDADGNHWKCNMCDYKCVYKADMVSHTSVDHDEKSQFKCTVCAFKTISKIVQDQHIAAKHPNDSTAQCFIVYQRIKSQQKKSTETAESNLPEEHFDTTPLWRRDMPRVRHIRGILLEEEELAGKGTKRKSDGDPTPARPAKIKPGKSASLDENKLSKEKSKRFISSDDDRLDPSKDDTGDKCETNELKETEIGTFGPYGKPVGNLYFCSLCSQFKTKYKHDLRDHLYRELKYMRWQCKLCGFLSIVRNTLMKHFAKHHNDETVEPEPLSPDNMIEEWVGNVLMIQTQLMKAALNKTTPVKKSVTGGSPLKSVLGQKEDKLSKTSGLQKEEGLSLKSDEDDSRDNDLIIHLDDLDKEEDSEVFTSPTATAGGKDIALKKVWCCKHCSAKFSKMSGLKNHITKAHHLKRFLCPYCDDSANSESLLKHHMRSKHPGLQEKVIPNPDFVEGNWSDEVWEREYGITALRKTKKRKRAEDGINTKGEGQDDHPSVPEICNVCGFSAATRAGLMAHMRSHTMKHNIKCPHCTFSCHLKPELREHWEVNHSHLPLILDEAESEDRSPDPPTKKPNLIDFTNDIEEEIFDRASPNKKTSTYNCFYCNFSTESLEILRKHWTSFHKDQSDRPFRYKEIHQSLLTKLPKFDPGKSGPSGNSGKSGNGDHTTSSSLGDWVCQWCNDICDTDAKRKAHHHMFHSHLPMNYKRENSREARKVFSCPECSFTTILISAMRKHVDKHIDLFKCKYCDKRFSTSSLVANHITLQHPGWDLRIESIPNYNAIVDIKMSKVVCKNVEPGDEKFEALLRNTGVAKKSTAKSTLTSGMLSPKFKAVARKSTNPLPRYPPGISFLYEQENSNDSSGGGGGVSHYGIKPRPIDLSKLNTYMVVSGHRMKVTCTTLAQLININVRVEVEDCVNKTKHQVSKRK